MNYFRVREHSLFGSRWSTSVVVLASNEYCFTYMVIARKQGMFNQNRTKPKQHNNRINELPSVAETPLRAGARNAARYAGC